MLGDQPIATMQTRTLFNKRASGLSMAGALVLLLIVVVVRFLASAPVRPAPSAIYERTSPSHRRIHRTSPVFDSETYYRTIIKNNLFRPLGWTPPRPIEPYRLIGTILPRAANTLPQAILQSTASNTTYIVSIGEKIDALTEVTSIQGKQVVLSTNGEQRTLHLPISF